MSLESVVFPGYTNLFRRATEWEAEEAAAAKAAGKRPGSPESEEGEEKESEEGGCSPCELTVTGSWCMHRRQIQPVTLLLPWPQCWRQVCYHGVDFETDQVLLEALGLCCKVRYTLECSCRSSRKLSPLPSRRRHATKRKV